MSHIKNSIEYLSILDSQMKTLTCFIFLSFFPYSFALEENFIHSFSVMFQSSFKIFYFQYSVLHFSDIQVLFFSHQKREFPILNPQYCNFSLWIATGNSKLILSYFDLQVLKHQTLIAMIKCDDNIKVIYIFFIYFISNVIWINFAKYRWCLSFNVVAIRVQYFFFTNTYYFPSFNSIVQITFL